MARSSPSTSCRTRAQSSETTGPSNSLTPACSARRASSRRRPRRSGSASNATSSWPYRVPTTSSKVRLNRQRNSHGPVQPELTRSRTRRTRTNRTSSSTTSAPGSDSRRPQRTREAHHHTQGVIMHGRPITQSLGSAHASHPNRWRILGVLVLALLVTSIDHTIINVAMPRLVGDLGASSAQLQWIVASYTIVFAGLLLTAGSLGDRFGRRHALLAGLATFLAGSVVAAMAT